jgi:phasin family protein
LICVNRPEARVGTIKDVGSAARVHEVKVCGNTRFLNQFILTTSLEKTAMQATANPMLDVQRRQIGTSRQMAEVVFDGTDRIEHLMLETTRKAFDEQMKFLQALTAVRDPQGFAALQSTFFSRTPDQMVKVQQELMRIVSEAQEQLRSTMGEYASVFNGAGMPMSMPIAMAPETSETLTGNGALANMYAVWDKAFKDVIAMANRTVEAVQSSARNGAHAADPDVVQPVSRAKPAARKTSRRK